MALGFKFLVPWLLGSAAVLIVGCSGPQSTLEPAGKGAEKIANLFWCMLTGGAIIWMVMIGLAIFAARTHLQGSSEQRVRMLIIGGGTVVPTIVLSALLFISLPMLPELLEEPPADALRIEVRGKMWWWRVRYSGPNGETIELANEIRLPVGQPVEFRLASDDVIHSFWIPALGGKVDMFPGRDTRLKLEPTRTGVYRGACAEFCGSSHALMEFDVIVMESKEFDLWLRQQQESALTPSQPLAQRGQQLFIASGCQACHTVRGIGAQGTLGPDLTHVGSRHSLAGGNLANNTDGFVQWISHPDALKPDVNMPGFGMLSDEQLVAIAAYLESLK